MTGEWSRYPPVLTRHRSRVWIGTFTWPEIGSPMGKPCTCMMGSEISGGIGLHGLSHFILDPWQRASRSVAPLTLAARLEEHAPGRNPGGRLSLSAPVIDKAGVSTLERASTILANKSV